jgi:hypothetical protein
MGFFAVMLNWTFGDRVGFSCVAGEDCRFRTTRSLGSIPVLGTRYSERSLKEEDSGG